MANQILIHVNCPVDNGNVQEMAASHEAALKLFTNQCPVGARVAEVVGIRGKGQEKCAWRARYLRNLNPQNEYIDGQQLVLQILNAKPNNTDIIKKNRTCFPPGLDIVYSIGCMCDVSRNAGMLFKSSVPVEEVKTELDNLKVEESIQE